MSVGRRKVEVKYTVQWSADAPLQPPAEALALGTGTSTSGSSSNSNMQQQDATGRQKAGGRETLPSSDSQSSVSRCLTSFSQRQHTVTVLVSSESSSPVAPGSALSSPSPSSRTHTCRAAILACRADSRAELHQASSLFAGKDRHRRRLLLLECRLRALLAHSSARGIASHLTVSLSV